MEQDVKQANETAAVESAASVTDNQTSNVGDTSNPANADNSASEAIPYSRLQQVVKQKNTAIEDLRKKDEEARILKDRIEALEKANTEAPSNVEVAEGLQPFTGDIERIIDAKTAGLKQENEAMRQQLQQNQLSNFEQNVRTQETDIRKKYDGSGGYKPYDEVMGDMQEILKTNPAYYNDLEGLYLHVNRDSRNSYVSALEAKAGISQTERAKANATPEVSTTESRVPGKPQNFQDKIRAKAAEAQNRLQSE